MIFVSGFYKITQGAGYNLAAKGGGFLNYYEISNRG
jgi:hypothetical protein